MHIHTSNVYVCFIKYQFFCLKYKSCCYFINNIVCKHRLIVHITLNKCTGVSMYTQTFYNVQTVCFYEFMLLCIQEGFVQAAKTLHCHNSSRLCLFQSAGLGVCTLYLNMYMCILHYTPIPTLFMLHP